MALVAYFVASPIYVYNSESIKSFVKQSWIKFLTRQSTALYKSAALLVFKEFIYSHGNFYQHYLHDKYVRLSNIYMLKIDRIAALEINVRIIVTNFVWVNWSIN